MLTHLPTEIFFNILEYLDIPSLLIVSLLDKKCYTNVYSFKSKISKIIIQSDSKNNICCNKTNITHLLNHNLPTSIIINKYLKTLIIETPFFKRRSLLMFHDCTNLTTIKFCGDGLYYKGSVCDNDLIMLFKVCPNIRNFSSDNLYISGRCFTFLHNIEIFHTDIIERMNTLITFLKNSPNIKECSIYYSPTDYWGNKKPYNQNKFNELNKTFNELTSLKTLFVRCNFLIYYNIQYRVGNLYDISTQLILPHVTTLITYFNHEIFALDSIHFPSLKKVYLLRYYIGVLIDYSIFLYERFYNIPDLIEISLCSCSVLCDTRHVDKWYDSPSVLRFLCYFKNLEILQLPNLSCFTHEDLLVLFKKCILLKQLSICIDSFDYNNLISSYKESGKQSLLFICKSNEESCIKLSENGLTFQPYQHDTSCIYCKHAS